MEFKMALNNVVSTSAMQLLFIILSGILSLMMSGVHSSNILMLPAVGEGSHFSVMKHIADELISRGHNITMLVSDIYQERYASENNLNVAFFKSTFTQEDFSDFASGMTNAGLGGYYYSWLIEQVSSNYMNSEVSTCEMLLGDKRLMSTLRNSNLDLGIVDMLAPCPVMQYLKEHQGLPFVALAASPTRPSSVLLDTRSTVNPSYIPELTSGLSDRMSFFDRLYSSIFTTVFFHVTSACWYRMENIKRKQGIGHTSSKFADAELWFENTHFALDFPRPLLPNTIPVGGLTTKPSMPLTNDWEVFLNNSSDEGVILFSLGSYASGIDKHIAELFAGAFAQLPQKVIWKLSGNVAANLTSNVKVVDWMPQNDLLGHPQIKVFVTHCGTNGVWEAIYHGVPVIAIPLFGDQYDNAARIESRRIGVKVDITTLTSDGLAEAIRTVINDPSYTTNAIRISRLFRDKPREPTELVADWMEYVIRHGDLTHLRSAAMDLNVFQYLLLDVILFMLLVSVLMSIITIYCCRVFVRGVSSVVQRAHTKSKCE